MKELSIEEKAKAYDEALEKARCYYEGANGNEDMITMTTTMFPVLKESEDERIRKKIINLVKKHSVNHERCMMTAWLEKRGEQKPYGLREECKDCQCNYAGECKCSCAMKRNEQKPWGKEDENLFKLSLENLTELKDRFGEEYGKVGDCIVWFESLKDRVQPQQIWSDEDEKALKVITDIFEQYGVHLLNYPTFVHWLKILPERISYNSSWKPTEEQLDALNNMRFAVQHFGPSASLTVLDDLYNQLKKL